MLFVAFISWWYGPGWIGTIKESKRYLHDLATSFSVPILLRTLFSPWKQLDAYGRSNPTIGDRLRHQIDKFVSRFVGFLVRLLTLLAAGFSFAGLLILRAAWIVVWPCLPLLVPVALLYALGAG